MIQEHAQEPIAAKQSAGALALDQWYAQGTRAASSRSAEAEALEKRDCRPRSPTTLRCRWSRQQRDRRSEVTFFKAHPPEFLLDGAPLG